MKAILPVLLKVFVKEFYRINAGFFLVVVGLCFGFLRDVEHIALAQYFISSPTLLLIPFAGWLLYVLKIVGFNNLALKQPENTFLTSLGAIRPPSLWVSILVVSIQQFLPALLYGSFLILTAITFEQLTAVVEVISFLSFFIFWISFKLHWEILHPDEGRNVNFLQKKLSNLFVRPYSWFYPEWIARQQPGLVFGTKIFACLLLIGISRLYLFDTYDERLFQMGCALAFSSNLVIVFFYHRFTNFNFSILRGLPISLERRLGNFLLVLTILQLPEIGIMVNYFPSGISTIHLVTSMLFGLSISVVGYTSLYIRDLPLESFIRRIFGASILFVVLVLFKVPVGVLAIIHGLVGYAIYRKYYFQFEPGKDG